MSSSLISKYFFKNVFLIILLTAAFTLTGCKDDAVVDNGNGNNNNHDPDVPQLVEPQNNSVTQFISPLLKWSDFPNTTQYRVQVSMDANFVSTLFVDSIVSGNELTIRENTLTTNINFYWRVIAQQAGTNYSWSAVWSFKIILSPPAAPELLLPVNNAVNQSFLPLLDWNDPPTAQAYRLQISASQNFQNILLDSSGMNISQLQCPAMLLNTNTQYWWRVKASNSNGLSISEWSQSFTFTTVDGPEPNSISGTITFADANFVQLPNFYTCTAYSQVSWPPNFIPPFKISTLTIENIGGVYKANYKLTGFPNGIYYIASGINRTPVQNAVFGTYGCDTSRTLYSNCAFTPTKVTISENNGVTDINFLSWADSTKLIFQ